MLSWGPPHNPYHTAPERFRDLYDPERLSLRPNVPPDGNAKVAEALAGYYAHCSALDVCVGRLLDTLADCGLAEDTVFVFTSDHGDLVGSQGRFAKQKPYEESIRVPFLLRWPEGLGWVPRFLDAPIDAPDIMPTLLGLCGIPIPNTVEGLDYSDHVRGGARPDDGSVLLASPVAFHEWSPERGGREYRGIWTVRYTYCRDANGPWLLFDNERDPYQMNNMVEDAAHAELRQNLDAQLSRKLEEQGDDFASADELCRRWGYVARDWDRTVIRCEAPGNGGIVQSPRDD
jgi:arylsulfatase A-like enzyme